MRGREGVAEVAAPIQDSDSEYLSSEQVGTVHRWAQYCTVIIASTPHGGRVSRDKAKAGKTSSSNRGGEREMGQNT